MEKIKYNYIGVPVNLFYILDGNTSRVLTCLIQASDFFSKEDGFFFLTKEHMCSLLGMSVNVLTAALDTLYINGIISIRTVGASNGKYVNHYKVNFETFGEYEKLTFEELKNPELKIKTVKYKNNYQPQYIKDFLECNNERKQVRKKVRKKVITNKTNIANKTNINNNNYNNLNNIYNKNLKDNLNNIKENIYENILKEKSEELVEDLVNYVNNGEYVPSSINSRIRVEKSRKRERNLTPTASLTSTAPSNPLKASKEAIPDTLIPQVEQVSTPTLDAVKTPKKRLCGRSGDYYPNLIDLGYSPSDDEYVPVPLEVVSFM